MKSERPNGVSVAIRNKLMLACAIVMACVLATPAALAQNHHRGHRDNTGKVLGALVVGAVIGSVLASSNHQSGYYANGYPYPARAYYPPPVYRGYPTYTYYGQPGYPGYTYGSGARVGVVYGNNGYQYYRWARRYHHDNGRYDQHRHRDSRRHDNHRHGH